MSVRMKHTLHVFPIYAFLDACNHYFLKGWRSGYYCLTNSEEKLREGGLLIIKLLNVAFRNKNYISFDKVLHNTAAFTTLPLRKLSKI